MCQCTIRGDVKALGVGLHSGRLIQVELRPAPPNSGVVFVRQDLNGAALKADQGRIDYERLQFATTLVGLDAEGERFVVQTTEHLMSALYARGIDNVFVHLDGPEVPIMDGSAMPFLVLLDEAGVRQQRVPRRELRIEKPFFWNQDGKWVRAFPGKGLRLSYEIVYDHPLIQTQAKSVWLRQDTYESQVGRARTFGFLKDVEQLKKMGLIRGGSTDNAIVLDGDDMLNDGLRLRDEFVSHKILDFIGDLSLCGCRLKGHFSAFKAGHEAHALFLAALLASPSHYSIVEADSLQRPRLGQPALESAVAASL